MRVLTLRSPQGFALKPYNLSHTHTRGEGLVSRKVIYLSAQASKLL